MEDPGVETSRPRPGEGERVEGGLTETESVVDTSDVVEPVRSKEAAKRGRFATEIGDAFGLPLLRLIRAASWFKEGNRPDVEGLRSRSAPSAC